MRRKITTKTIIERSAKIRYVKEDKYYIITFNGKRFPGNYIAWLIGIDEETFNKTIIDTYGAETILIPYTYANRYIFKTRKQAKIAVEWLRSLEVARKMIQNY